MASTSGFAPVLERRKTLPKVVYLSPNRGAEKRRASHIRDAGGEQPPGVRQAKTSRTSIAARPQQPSAAAAAAAKARVASDRAELRSKGYIELQPDYDVTRHGDSVVASGPMIRGSHEETERERDLLANHLVTVRSKSIASQARHASWLVPKKCPLVGQHLMEACLKANSVNCVLFKKKSTESSSLQIPRCNFLPLADAQAAQQVSCLLTLAKAQLYVGKHCNVRELGARNAVSIADLPNLRRVCGDEKLFPACATTQLVPNVLPFKLTSVSMGSVGRDLARAELSPTRTITELCATLHATALRRLCHQCIGQSASDADPLWSTVGLLLYCGMTPAGRELLGSTQLTDFDYALAGTLDMYARNEIQRRERFDATTVEDDSAGGDDDDGDLGYDAEVAGLEAAARQKLAETQALLSSKKRRDASSIDPVLGAQWWVAASDTKHASVLKTLMCNSLKDAQHAALENLKYQAAEHPSLALNSILKDVSVRNAQDCVRAVLRGLACRAEADVPRFRRDETASSSDKEVVLQRCEDEHRKLACFATLLAQERLQPAAATSAIAWTVASIEPKSQLVFDKLKTAEAIRSTSPGPTMIARAERIEQEALRIASERPKTPESAALARSFFAHSICHRLNVSQEEAALRFAKDAPWVDFGDGGSARPPTEPFATTSPALASGLLVTDILTRWLAGKTRKVDFSLLQMAPSTPGEAPVPIPDVNSSMPLPLAVITDVRATQNAAQEEKGTVGIGLSLAVDGAVRLPEALRELQGNQYDAQTVQQCRALLWAGMSQASLIANLGNVLTCGSINSSISCSRRLTIADNQKWFGLSVFDCFVGGALNVEPLFLETPYAGSYGPVFDTGMSPPGKNGSNLKHDGRQHGSFSMSQELSDELAGFFAKNVFAVDREKKEYAPVPVAARGIPHMLTAGVYTALDDYVDGLERFREQVGRTANTADGIFVLPYAGVTQSLAPVAEEFADTAQTCGVRSEHVKRGHAYQPTATAEEDALLREPLFRRPSVATVYDNPFVSSYEYAETFYNLASGLVLLGRLDSPDLPPAPRVGSLFESMCAWVEDGDSLMRCPAAAYYADALLMIACMFPETHQINKPMIPEFLAVGIPALQRALRSSADDGDVEGPSLNLRALVDDDLCAAGRAFVAKLRRAWADIAPLLELLDELDGRHDLSRAKRTELRQAFERAARASYYFQLDDTGEIPYGNPAYGATRPEEVGRVALDPVIVGFEEEREEARGGILGMKPHALRQVAILAMGAFLDDVQVQVVRNEGGLSIRVSSAPDIKKADNSERTNKATSPIQMESDQKLFGTKEEKLVTCAAQRLAWDENIRLLAPILSQVSMPRPAAWRHRCRHGADQKLRVEAQAAHADMRISADEAAAKRDILRAATFEWPSHGGRDSGAGSAP